MMRITAADFASANASPAEKTLAREKLEQKQQTRRVVSALEALSVSFGFGWLHGRSGTMPTLGPVPYDALAGFALIGMSFIPQAKPYAEDLVALGTGAACYFVGAMGGELGQRMRKAKDDKGRSDWTGNNGVPGGTPNDRTITSGPQQVQWSKEQLEEVIARNRAQ